MNCVIIDDDKISLKLLSDYISRTPDLTLDASFDNPSEALIYLQKNPADLLFLDIEMPEINGIDFLARFQSKPITIFITGYTEFAYNAFQLDALDYLLKPVSFESFLKAVNKAKIFMKGTSELVASTEHVLIRSSGRFHRVQYSDILFIEAVKDYVIVNTRNSKLPVPINMTTILKQLPSSQFLRIHKSFVINFDNADQLSQESVTLGNNHSPVGKTYADALLERLSEESVIRR